MKCDKRIPCSTCRKTRQECVYQEPAPRKRKRKPTDDVQERIEHYERILRENNLLPPDDDSEKSPVSSGPPTQASQHRSDTGVATHASAGLKVRGVGKLVQGRAGSRYIDSNVWRNLGEELHPDSDEEEDYGELNYAPEGADPIDPVSHAFLGPMSPMQSLLDWHPTYDLAMKLWKQYVQNVDPVVKLCHLPTTFEKLQRAAANPNDMSKATECLLFAIYHFAIVSTPTYELEGKFGRNWAMLQKTYHDATRQALVNCHFLRTTEMPVLQAYMLLLLSVRTKYDPHTFWILSGIAVRIAQRMGLHRDGEELGLNPFDVQVRRRVFWQLLPLDGISGQVSGTGIAITPDSWDTKQPLNINDEDMWPGMEHPITEHKGATEMMFCLARTEIGKFHQKVKPVFGDWSKLWEGRDLPAIHEALDQLESHMEETYIRYCDIADPVHCLTLAMARGAANSGRLRVRLPRASGENASPEERRDFLTLVNKVLDYDIAVNHNPILQRFNWHFKSFFNWDGLIWMLKESRRKDSILDRDAAWAKIQQLYDAHPELREGRRALDVALGRLTVKSWQATHPTGTEPKFILELREGLQRRQASRTATETPSEPPPVHAIDPALEQSQDVPFATVGYMNTNMPWGFPNFGMLEDMINTDQDWTMWEQLIREPDAFPVT